MAVQLTLDSSDRVIIADSTASDLPSGDWSIGIRFKFTTTTDTGQDPYLFTKKFDGASHIYIGVTSTGGTTLNEFFAGFDDGSLESYVQETSPNTFSTGVWYTVVCVRSSGTTTLYVNNSSRDTDATAIGAVQPAGNVWIGNREETPPIDRGFPGDLAEAFICDYALSADDRQAYEYGYSPEHFSKLPTWYAPLMDQNQDEVINGDAISTSGSIVDTDHPPVIYEDGDDYTFTPSIFYLQLPTPIELLSAYAPTVAPVQAVSMPSAPELLSAYAPTIVYDQYLGMPSPSELLTAYAPTVAQEQGLSFGTPEELLTVYLPTLRYIQNLAMPAPIELLTAYAPTVTFGFGAKTLNSTDSFTQKTFNTATGVWTRKDRGNG